jgi:transcription elongation factor Elf1
MPDSLLRIQCPHCDHDQVRLFIRSLTVLTVKCLQCGRPWSIEVAALPPDTRRQLANALEQ